MTTVQSFLDAFHDPTYQAQLERLYASLGRQQPEDWARDLYEALRDRPFAEPQRQLNIDRKACLQLLYNMVDCWEACPLDSDKEQFEQDIRHIFQTWRLKRILYIGLLMDRAQSLYCMRIPTSRLIGMHWFCKSHLEAGNEYAVAFPEEQQNLRLVVLSQDYQGGFATMNRRLYTLLYRFGLLNDPQEEGAAELARWSRPAMATFVDLSETNPMPGPFAG